jgi:hypothetical protein
VIYVHREAKFAFAFSDNESAYLGVCEFIVLHSGETGVVIGHRVYSVSTRRLSKKNGKNL